MTEMDVESFSSEERHAVFLALSDYLAPYTNPMILGPEPQPTKKKSLRAMARAYIKMSDVSSVGLEMGDWRETVTVDGSE